VRQGVHIARGEELGRTRACALAVVGVCLVAALVLCLYACAQIVGAWARSAPGDLGPRGGEVARRAEPAASPAARAPCPGAPTRRAARGVSAAPWAPALGAGPILRDALSAAPKNSPPRAA
jgi:hypothetical protein